MLTDMASDFLAPFGEGGLFVGGVLMILLKGLQGGTVVTILLIWESRLNCDSLGSHGTFLGMENGYTCIWEFVLCSGQQNGLNTHH